MNYKGKKALVFTINDYMNYGNRLQNYALIKILRDLGIAAKNAPQIFCKENYVCASDGLIEKIIKWVMPYKFWKKRMQLVFHNDINERYKNFLKFAALYEDVPAVVYVKRNNEILEKMGGDVSYFVSGSDQVWNPNFFKNLYINMLGFAPDDKKIAIAPSISAEQLLDWQKKEFKKYLPSFKALSCREKSGSDMIKEITGTDCVTLIDPTLMLSSKEWDNVIKKPFFHEDEKYFLVYFLGNITAEYQQIIDNIAKKYNLKIIDVYDKDNKYYQCGPSEFVWLIKNCELMLTDSFHGTVFSYIYNRPVRIFKRQDNLGSMNSRLINLIHVLHLDDIYIDPFEESERLFETNYNKEYLEAEKNQFAQYLLEALGVE